MFEKGKIVAQGTLSEMKKNKKFATMFRKYKVEKQK